MHAVYLVIAVVVFLAVGAPFIVFMGYGVHVTMNRICMRHARRFCRKNHLQINRVRHQIAFDKSGVKTEFTLVQVDCRDVQKQHKLLTLLVSPFGVRRTLSNEVYPDSYDEKWPVASAGKTAGNTLKDPPRSSP